jgi:hypothetical protein
VVEPEDENIMGLREKMREINRDIYIGTWSTTTTTTIKPFIPK